MTHGFYTHYYDMTAFEKPLKQLKVCGAKVNTGAKRRTRFDNLTRFYISRISQNNQYSSFFVFHNDNYLTL